ncbi:DUF4426 domain-containing protein [Alishewanella sp. 16-MA]|uniref:DUF4426 domain-containing protein n=1 Tax=Alishewanella maricola TaxID=2795740 RepID=A0ABS8C0D7_9ALTE|nr:MULTISPECIES: DUF4426 domain-containing protein [Gammaproteobacteria]MDP4945228.1 DUF4426 domain-containing protein [Alishewanella sp.]MDP5207088.1 DUF4426 domain-containing protein [Alishewanella sp. SMS9]MCB5225777.1 DUF4426 domain-containing protein [Alishewanella maricola]MCC5450985.1 DUF4426 domain-containing protein [Rheinheimera sp. UJ51]MCF4007948.1 DUF4426 domain-containing protein [Rheinheimera sp. UJ63]
MQQRTTHYLLYLLMLSSFLFAGTLQAEQKKQLGDWDIHYIAFNSTFLTPEVARAANLSRNKNNAIINISVLDTQTQQAQAVIISGIARNLLGQQRSLTFREIKDGAAIYYIAVMPFRNEEQFRFSLDIRQGNTRQQLNFEQKLYTE